MRLFEGNAAPRVGWLACALAIAVAAPLHAGNGEAADGFSEIKIAPGTAESPDFMELIRPFLMIDPMRSEGNPSLDLKVRKTESGYRFDVMTGGVLDDSISGTHYRGHIIRYEGDRWLLIELSARDICVRGRSETGQCR